MNPSSFSEVFVLSVDSFLDEFRQLLLDWYDQNARPLPWRKDHDPYRVWISEIMAQQTQMDRVVPYFERFVRAWPDVTSLACADEDELLRMWEGLGYYNRARNLRRAACVVLERHEGVFPSSREEMEQLPGIGPYTSGAIASVAFNQPVVAIDANVERVFSRVFDLGKPVKEPTTRAFIEDRARTLLPRGAARRFNQALMELGALVCTPRTPACHRCPMSELCRARQQGTVLERPVKGEAKQYVKIVVATGVLINDGRVYIQKRRPDDVWPGLWEFPGGCMEQGETPEQTVVREFLEETACRVQVVDPIATVNYSYTKYRVTLHGHYLRYARGYQHPQLLEAVDGRFVRPDELDRYAFPSGHRKLARFIASDARFARLLSRL